MTFLAWSCVPDEPLKLVMITMPDADLVLVIDDEPQIRRAVRDALRDVTSRVDEAGNGLAGVDSAATNHPDLVADSCDAVGIGWKDTHASADLRRSLGSTVWKSAAVSARAHHELASKDRSRSSRTADHHHGARSRISRGVIALIHGTPSGRSDVGC